MGQVRAMKIGLEARLKCNVESDWKIMEWITELAGELLSRGQVGKDGRTAYFRLYGRHSATAVLEIGERWVFATGVGVDAKINEHVVVIGEGGAAIRVRTVLRRPASDRWNVDAAKAMRASPRVPNPDNLRQAKVMPERLTKKIEVEGDGSKIQEQVRRFQEFKFREFKITKGILEKVGFSDKCKGCEAAASRTDATRHTDDCRQKAGTVDSR